MSFEPKKYKDLFEDMRRRSSVLTDFEVGSVSRTIFESFSYELALLYEKMQLVYLSAFVDSAKGNHLDQVVSILGVSRGQPDYSIGAVTFTRDPGADDIVIPLGTLIATEDSPESPKKVYQTTEEKVIGKNQSAIVVKVQAMDRGSEMDTDAETVVVMPRPIPGIKAVNNEEAITLIGKRRETDEELRERAKNALISSGNATVLSIENAVLKLPGVRDVKVKEDFYYAKGKLRIRRVSSAAGETIPFLPEGTLVQARLEVDGATRFKNYLTQDRVEIEETGQMSEVVIKSTEKGAVGLLSDPSAAKWNIPNSADYEVFIDAAAGEMPLEPIKLSDFGVIEVFVDGPDFVEEPEAAARIRKEIDRVRAAGVFVILDSARSIKLNGIFRITPGAQQNFTVEERAEFEKEIGRAIRKFLSTLKMGDSLQFAQLIKEILNLDNVENLDDFQLIALKRAETGALVEEAFDFSRKKIEIEEFERLIGGEEIAVASEDKVLPVDVEFHFVDINENTPARLRTDLGSFFSNLKQGEEVRKEQVRAKIEEVLSSQIAEEDLKLTPRPWSPRSLLSEDGNVLTSFVEKPQLGDVFVYQTYLDMTGAILLSLRDNLPDGVSPKVVKAKVLEKIEAHLDALKSEESLLFEDLVKVAKSVEHVLDASIEAGDFVVETGASFFPEQVAKDKITVKLFEKIRIKRSEAEQGGEERYLCLAETGTLETTRVRITALSVNLLEGTAEEAALENALKGVVSTFLLKNKAGEDVSFENLKLRLDSALPFADYTIIEFAIKAVSDCDGRIQEASIANPADIHIRSVEKAKMAALSINNFIVVKPAPNPDVE